MEMVRVLWYDAHTVAPEWTEIDGLDASPCECETVGFLAPAKTKPGHVVVFLNTAHGHSFGGDGIAIPEAMVASVEVLSVQEIRSWRRKARKWWSSLRRF